MKCNKCGSTIQDDITLCPGHGPMTTLGAERPNLEYFKVAI